MENHSQVDPLRNSHRSSPRARSLSSPSTPRSPDGERVAPTVPLFQGPSSRMTTRIQTPKSSVPSRAHAPSTAPAPEKLAPESRPIPSNRRDPLGVLPLRVCAADTLYFMFCKACCKGISRPSAIFSEVSRSGPQRSESASGGRCWPSSALSGASSERIVDVGGGTGSKPAFPNGWQRASRQRVSQVPIQTPRVRYASAEYWEQVG